MPTDRLVFDTWTPMSFKAAIGRRNQPGIRFEEPTWVGDHARRLAAYKVLRSYIDNAAREFLVLDSEEDRSNHREYGDAALLVQTILTALVGDNQKIVTADAADYSPPKGGDNTGAPKPDGEGGDQADPPGALGTIDPTVKAAWDFQEWLREQWKVERGPMKLYEVESTAIGIGDGVYTVGWSPDKKRARIRVWDPGFYFPVLDDGNEDDFPEKVHIAWEYYEKDGVSNKCYVRRITYELVTVDSYTLAYGGTATKTCLLTDATWEVNPTEGRTVEDFSYAKATFKADAQGTLDHRDLEIDFLPVIHIPNTPSVQPVYGRSSISSVLQVLDDIANSDTDAQAASATAARPVMALEGGTLGRVAPQYRPGDVYETGDGKLSFLDTSKALDAILKYLTALMDRLTTNARTPDALLGRIKPSEVPSGIAMAMSFGPLVAMIGQMRLTRAEKYPLLFKFLWRINKVGQAADVPAKWYDSELRFGSYLPQDKTAVIKMVADLLDGNLAHPAISIQTAVALLMANGFPIEDANEEIRRIQAENFKGADDLRTATGSQDAVFGYLHMDKPADAVLPVAPPVSPTNGRTISGDPATDPNATQRQTKPGGIHD